LTYDPDVARLIETMNRVPRARFQGQTVEETREAYRLSCRIGGLPTVAMASIRDRQATPPRHVIALRLYRPEGLDDTLPPALIYFHGAGWAVAT